jgi:hypothetical protein
MSARPFGVLHGLILTFFSHTCQHLVGVVKSEKPAVPIFAFMSGTRVAWDEFQIAIRNKDPRLMAILIGGGKVAP